MSPESEWPADAPPVPPTAAVEILPDMQAAAAGQLLLRQQLAGWRALEPAVRSGADPEALHQLRVTGRRMIAMLRIVEAAPLGGALRLRRRLQSLLRASSAARDLDVQIAEFEALGGSPLTPGLQPLLERLHRQRARRRSQLQRLLDAPRAVQLFGALEVMAGVSRPQRRGRPVAVVVERLIRHRYRRVRRAARTVAEDAAVARCHALRLETKKLRYLAEPFAALYGEPLQEFLRGLQRLQSLLGRINDAHHAMTTLETEAQRSRRGLPPRAAYAMGRGAEQQHARWLEALGRVDREWRRVRGRRWRNLLARMREVTAALPAATTQ
jgi:CHAD domain-containing protein